MKSMSTQKERLFHPKLLSTLSGYRFHDFARDALSGLMVAIIAIPLSIAFGISSGVTPAQGLLTAIVAGFIISALGGSRVQIGGPTGAFIVIIYGIVTKYGVPGLIVATFMAGVILMVLGLLRFGSVVRYIPQSIITGFTAGIAIVILSSQFKDALGLDVAKMPAEFLGKIETIVPRLGGTNLWALGLCLGTAVIIWTLKRFAPRVPGAFVALAGMTLLAWLAKLPVATIGSTYGALTLSINPLDFSTLKFSSLGELIGPAFSIAFLGAIESLLSAAVADGMIGGKYRPNTELIAQGAANMATAFVGGIPATGAIVRTAANVRNGGRTPVAGMLHAVFILIIVLACSSLASWIPMSVLAGILLTVALAMGEWKEVLNHIRTSREEAVVLIATGLGTIFVDLIFGIGLGMSLAAVIVIKNTMDHSAINPMGIPESKSFGAKTDEEYDTYYGSQGNLARVDLPPHTAALDLSGSFFFGAAGKFDEMIRSSLVNQRHLILRCASLDMIDSSGLHILKRIITDAHKAGIQVYLAEVPLQIRGKLDNSGMSGLLGSDHYTDSLEQAVERIRAGKVHNPSVPG